jgi:hypothetical protein
VRSPVSTLHRTYLQPPVDFEPLLDCLYQIESYENSHYSLLIIGQSQEKEFFMCSVKMQSLKKYF